jgi:hypothetical protein
MLQVLMTFNVSGWRMSIQVLHRLWSHSFDFHFLGSGCRETTMLEILKRLSSSCGPLILYEPVAGTPVLVTSTIEVDGALKEWQQRIQKNYDKAPQ